MGRPLPAVLAGLLLLGAMSAAVVGLWALATPYVEYGEPADRPYVVLRVYGGSAFHVEDPVRAEVVLVNPGEQEAVARWSSTPPVPYVEIVSAEGESLFRWWSLDTRWVHAYRSDPGGEVVLARTLWLPTTVDLKVSGRHLSGALPEDPTPFYHGSLFCNERVEGETYSLEVWVNGFSARNGTAGPEVRVPFARLRAPLTFHGVPGPCLAERPPTLELRVDRPEAALNESVRLAYVLRNPRASWVSVAVDFAPVLSLEIAAENGSVVFASTKAGSAVDDAPRFFFLENVSFALPPGGEAVLGEVWWNETSVWASHYLFGRPFGRLPVPADLRHPNQTFTVTGHLGWLTLWEGPAYDWDGTPVPRRVAPQASSVQVRFA